MHKENLKKKRRDLEQASLDAASDLLDTDSNATFAMVYLKNSMNIIILTTFRNFHSIPDFHLQSALHFKDIHIK